MVCFSSRSKDNSKDRDRNMSMITHAGDRKRKATMIKHEEHQHRALPMLASNNNQADQEHSHAMSTVQDTVSQ